MHGRYPPANFQPNPHPYLLPAGTRLWRVHHRTRSATDFCLRPAAAGVGGGRFDGTAEDPYPTYYAGLDARTALAEKLLRDVPFDEWGIRTVLRAKVTCQRTSVVETTTDVALVSLLDEAALAAVATDQWLVHADAAGYPATRRWATWIRARTSWAQGFIWPSKREAGKRSVVLFGDRCARDALSVSSSSIVDLDDEVGAVWINVLLAPYRARIMHPGRQSATVSQAHR